MLRATLFLLNLCAFTFVLNAQLERDSLQILMDVSRVRDIHLIDIDSDTDLDILASRWGHNGRFVWLENLDGLGTFGPAFSFGDTIWFNYPTILDYHYEVADMNNDGKEDIITPEGVASTLPYWENLGDVNFEKALYDDPLGIGSHEFSYTTGDFNADGWKDILILEIISSQASRLLINWNPAGNNNEFILEALSAPEMPAMSYIHQIDAFDYNQDNILDFGVLAGKSSGNTTTLALYIYKQSCEGCFALVDSLPVGVHPYNTVFANFSWTDFNADGWPDLCTSYDEGLDAKLKVWENITGSGSFSLKATFEDFGYHTITDLNQDGKADILAGQEEELYLLENVGDFLFDSVKINKNATLRGLSPVDLNLDGYTDIISWPRKVNGTHNSGIYFHEAKGNELEFFPPQLLSKQVPLARQVSAMNDWNDDGQTDWLISTPSSGSTIGGDGGLYFVENLGEGEDFAPPKLILRYDGLLNAKSTVIPGDDGFRQDFTDLNLDGRPDIVGITDTGNHYQLFYWIADPGDTSPNITVHNDDFHHVGISDIYSSDLDSDGDPDLLVNGTGGKIVAYWNQLAEGNGLVQDVNFLELPESYTSGSAIIVVADFNTDGFDDLVYQTQDSLYYAIHLDGGSTFSEWHSMKGSSPLLRRALVADFDGDGDKDIKYLIDDEGVFSWVLSKFQTESNSFSSPFIIDYNTNQLTTSSSTIHLNNDLAADMISYLGYRFSFPGAGFHSTPYIPTPFGNRLNNTFWYNAQRVDINQDGKDELYTGLEAMVKADLDWIPQKAIKGFVSLDTSENCLDNPLSPPLVGWPVNVQSGNISQQGISNQLGLWGAVLPESEEHIISPSPPSNYWQLCEEQIVLSTEEASNLDTLYIKAQSRVDCPLLKIQMETTPLRQCFGASVSVKYENIGTATIEDGEVRLFHDPRFTPVTSTLPWSVSTDSSLVFQLPVLEIGTVHQFKVEFEPSCEELMLGEWVCFQAEASPDTLCNHESFEWSGAQLVARTECQDNSMLHIVRNTGHRAMTAPLPYFIVSLDSGWELIQYGLLQLDAGAADTFMVDATNEATYLMVDQPQGHPFPEPIRLTSSSCPPPDSELWPSIGNAFPSADGNPFSVNACDFIIGPYDPNIKQGIPEGVGEQHFIQSDNPINYTIHFQNTGSDMARTVVLRDTLPAQLNLGTFTPGPASHSNEWSILPGGELVVVFTDINLPDSTTNEPESHGFFSYTIQPVANTPPLTIIENRAAIYFDFNPPVITNNTLHTIQQKKLAYSITEHMICRGDNFMDVLINQDTILLESLSTAEQDSFIWHSISAVDTVITENYIELTDQGYWEGIWVENDTSITQFFTNTMGCDSLITFHIDIITSTTAPGNTPYILVYPNPANRLLNIDLKNCPDLPEHLRIYDMTGKLIFSRTLSGMNKDLTLNLSSFTSGTYLLELQLQEGFFRQLFSKW